MKRYLDLVQDCRATVSEIFPWDLEPRLKQSPRPFLLDVREPREFEQARIEGSINVPRGILEAACEWGYEDTIPELVEAREQEIVVICRSGYRSLLAARTMQLMGYLNVTSLKTGLSGWVDAEQALVDADSEELDEEVAEEIFTPRVRKDQMRPR